MAVNVRIPTPLRKLTKDKDTVQAAGATIQDIIESLEKQYPGLKERLCDERGELRRFVNVYLNDEDIRFAQGKSTPVKDSDEISVIPAIAGGRHEGQVVRGQAPKGIRGKRPAQNEQMTGARRTRRMRMSDDSAASS